MSLLPALNWEKIQLKNRHRFWVIVWLPARVDNHELGNARLSSDFFLEKKQILILQGTSQQV